MLFAFVALHELMFGHTRTAHNRTSRTRRAHAQQPSLCPPTRGPSSAEQHVLPTAKTPSPTSEQPRARNRATPARPMRTTPPARPCGSRQHLDVGKVDATRFAIDEHNYRPVTERPCFGSGHRVHGRDAVEWRVDGPVANDGADRMRRVPRLGRVCATELSAASITLSVHASHRPPACRQRCSAWSSSSSDAFCSLKRALSGSATDLAAASA